MKPQTEPVDDDAPRIQPQSVDAMQADWLATLARIPGEGLKGKYAPVHVLGTLMHNPRTMGPFLEYWVSSKLEMAYTVREQELVILRMGYLYNCPYVWKHHVPVAREFGVTEAELAAVKNKEIPHPFSDRENALLRLTDELVEQRTIRREAWQTWATLLQPGEIVDLISLVSQYVLFALVNNAVQVRLETALDDIPGL